MYIVTVDFLVDGEDIPDAIQKVEKDIILKNSEECFVQNCKDFTKLLRKNNVIKKRFDYIKKPETDDYYIIDNENDNAIITKIFGSKQFIENLMIYLNNL